MVSEVSKLPKRVCMVVHAYYPADETRVKREAELLVRHGVKVEVICLRKQGEESRASANGVEILRLPVRRHRGASTVVYILEYMSFMLLASFVLIKRSVRRAYDIVQFHTPPDYIVYAGLGAKLFGSKIVLDMHETMPDLVIDRLKLMRNSLVLRLVCLSEKLSARFADAVLTVSEPVRKAIEARTGLDNIGIVMNVADESLFLPKETSSGSDAVSIVYHGMITKSYDLRPVLKAMQIVRQEIDNFFLDVYGEGEMLSELKEMAISLKLERHISFRGFIPMEDVAREIQRADIGVVPVTNSYYAKFALPTKLLEYARVGIPTLVPRFDTIGAYFSEEMVQSYEPSNVEDLARKLGELIHSKKRRDSITLELAKFARAHSWEMEGETYLGILGKVTGW